MKIKKTITVTKCEMCDANQHIELEFGKPHPHTMFVVSVFDPVSKKRKYADLCSEKCLLAWAKKPVFQNEIKSRFS
jgi:hypothetical protein